MPARTSFGLLIDRQSGRCRIACRDHSFTYFYRAVVEAELGRQLQPDEHVHHINGDVTDDRLSNLRILSIEEHGALHAPEAVKARRRNWLHDWSARHPECTDCGTTRRQHYARGMCKRCYHRNARRAYRAGLVWSQR